MSCSMVVWAALLLTVPEARPAAKAVGGPGTFAGYVHVRQESRSVWGDTDVSISIAPGGTGSVVTTFSKPTAPSTSVRRDLKRTEVNVLLDLLRKADLYRGQTWGTDEQYIDRTFSTLRVDDGGRVAVVVMSGNASFGNGPREALVYHLLEIQIGGKLPPGVRRERPATGARD